MQILRSPTSNGVPKKKLTLSPYSPPSIMAIICLLPSAELVLFLETVSSNVGRRSRDDQSMLWFRSQVQVRLVLVGLQSGFEYCFGSSFLVGRR
ncbi:hypothetical protein Tco_0350856 [Tanacetum coccineum]